MKEDNLIKLEYNETMLKILIAEVNILLAYWNISEEYDKKFTERYGNDFFDKTKQVLRVKCLKNGVEDIIEIKEPTSHYYIKINYSDSEYQVELLRVGKEDNKDYGYKIISNKIQSPNIKILINDYNIEEINFKNLKTGNDSKKNRFYNPEEYKKEDIEFLYEELIRPAWNEYKKENGYKEK